MKTHDLLDAANLDPAAWVLTAGVYIGKPSEETDEYLGQAFDDMCDATGHTEAGWFPEHRWAGIIKRIGEPLLDSRFKAKGTCDHCGAWFKFGFVFTHTTGAVCVVGHTCAYKSFAVPDRMTLELNRAREAAAAIAKAAKMKAAALAQAVAGGFEWLYNETHVDRILTDIAAKGRQYGELTPRQVDLVKRIHSGTPSEYQVERDRKAAQRDAERTASNYQGEVGKPITVDLEIVVTAERDGYMAGQTNHWHLMKSADGHFMTYSGSTSLGGRGGKLTGTFTVKAHEEYKGTKQTKLARPRKVTKG